MRALQADTLEQLGYQAEATTWRGIYLTGAKELRDGVFQLPSVSTASPDTVKAMSLPLLFNYLGVRLNGPRAAGKVVTLNLSLTDTGETAVLELRSGALSHSVGRTAREADATVALSREALNGVLLGQAELEAEIANGSIAVDPHVAPLRELLDLLDTFELWFNVVEP